MPKSVVLDTNVLVASLFNPKSNSAKIVRDIQKQNLKLVWDETTYKETKDIIKKIPRIEWDKVSNLFKEENKYEKDIILSEFEFVEDPADRKFISLSKKTGSTLITNDSHLPKVKNETNVDIFTPRQFLDKHARK